MLILTLRQKPWASTFSSAPINRKNVRAEGNKLSPMWYLGNLSASSKVTS